MRFDEVCLLFRFRFVSVLSHYIGLIHSIEHHVDHVEGSIRSERNLALLWDNVYVFVYRTSDILLLRSNLAAKLHRTCDAMARISSLSLCFISPRSLLITCASAWDHSRMMLGSLWDNSRIHLGLWWGCPGIVSGWSLGSSQDYIWVVLWICWDYPRVTLGSL